jgi:4-diphosphocytidyl-2-C-methyl-D-erythritol kinase
MSLTVTEFAPAKINLALHVLGRRSDGYHELDSIVAFANVGDGLELQPASVTSLSVDGPFASDVPTTGDNLVLRAYAALAQLVELPPVTVRLTKNLPVASGIGGGSADAAAALRGLMRLSGAPLATDALTELALSLGADVPVCLFGKACRMQGVGEVIAPVAQVPAPAILLVNPLAACGTADVFRGMGLKPGDVAGSAVDVHDPSNWRNDMTVAACAVLPVISQVLDALSTLHGKTAHRMSGSGATCFALFDQPQLAEAAREQLALAYPQWWVKAALLR